jgi:hypothetical protein
MGLQLYGGTLLAVGTDLANHADCCCGETSTCLDCAEDATYLPLLITATLSSMTVYETFSGCESQSCDSLDGSHSLSFTSGCTWVSDYIEMPDGVWVSTSPCVYAVAYAKITVTVAGSTTISIIFDNDTEGVGIPFGSVRRTEAERPCAGDTLVFDGTTTGTAGLLDICTFGSASVTF